MKRIAALVFLSVSAPFAGALLLLIVADAHASAGKLLAAIRESNLRKAPSTQSEIVMVVPTGTVVEVDNCHDGWCQVSRNGKRGYIIARNLGISTAAPPWPPVPVAAWHAYDRGQWLKANKATIAGTPDEHGAEHSFILEIGAAGEWPLDGERANFGGTIAGEVEPIENWLELEFGFTTLATAGRTEISGDLLFKKPFRSSPTIEFMVGAGPSLSRTLNGPDQGNSWSVEFALDWMFWPAENLGWYIEPTWSVNPRNGQQSAAVSIGILIGFPK